jgi:hypothetical protein
MIGLGLMLIAPALHAQSFKDRLVSMRKTYDTISKVHIRMTVSLFESDQSNAPYIREVADVKRDKRNYRYEFGTTNMLMNDKYLIVVDRNAREMMCSKRSLKGEDNLFTDPMKISMDSILAFYENPTLVSREKGIEHYTMTQKKGPIKRVDLFIGQATSLLQKMEYRYADGHYVVIEFTTFDTRPPFDENTFHEKMYVVADKGKLKASAPFNGYSVSMMDKQ